MMVNKYKNAFQSVGVDEPNPRIFEAVLSRIEEEEARQAKKMAAANLALAALSFFVAIYLAKHFLGSSYAIDLYYYLSLIWSDASFVFSNLLTYLQTLAVALPVGELSGIGLTIMALVYCLKRILSCTICFRSEIRAFEDMKKDYQLS